MALATGIAGSDRLADKVDIASVEIAASITEEDFWFVFTHGEETYQSSSSDVSDFFQTAKVLRFLCVLPGTSTDFLFVQSQLNAPLFFAGEVIQPGIASYVHLN